MNSNESVGVNQSIQVLKQLENFENSDMVIVICYLIMSISKFLLTSPYKSLIFALISVGIMSNTWILILAGRQSRRRDIR